MVRKLPRQTDYFSSGAFLAWRCKNETFPVQAASGKSAALPFFFFFGRMTMTSTVFYVLYCVRRTIVFSVEEKKTQLTMTEYVSTRWKERGHSDARMKMRGQKWSQKMEHE